MTKTGQWLGGWGASTHTHGDLIAAHAVGIDSQGSLYVGETIEGARLQKFDRVYINIVSKALPRQVEWYLRIIFRRPYTEKSILWRSTDHLQTLYRPVGAKGCCFRELPF